MVSALFFLMDTVLIKTVLLTYLFGPAIGLPFAGGEVDLALVAGLVLFLQALTAIVIFKILHFVDYGSQCKRHVINKICLFTEKEIVEVRKNADTLIDRFHRRGGHHGYYISLVFFSFAFGFVWAVVIAYSLKLRRRYSFIPILLGSSFSFAFWFLVLQYSLNFVTAEGFTMLSISMALLFFSYGRIRERREIVRVTSAIRSAGTRTKSVIKRIKKKA